jgi:hypothetical protein
MFVVSMGAAKPPTLPVIWLLGSLRAILLSPLFQTPRESSILLRVFSSFFGIFGKMLDSSLASLFLL